MPDQLRFELTARCPLDCRHCAINRPEGDRASRKRELTVEEIGRLAGEAVALGVTRCEITGGEPFLRPDFFEVYQAVLSRGAQVSVSTSAALITDEHVRFFKKFPPGSVVVSVFGVSRETYERVTRTGGSFAAFKKGLDRLLAGGVTVRLRAVALRSNKHEIAALAEFCRAWSKGSFEIAPYLDLRYDRDEARNVFIRAERLDPKEIVRLERSGPEHLGPVAPACAGRRPGKPLPEGSSEDRRRLFRCGAGERDLVVGPFGALRPCRALHHPDFQADLRKVSLRNALERLFPQALARETGRRTLPDLCRSCSSGSFCLWCPAQAYLETGKLDLPVEGLCRMAEARAEGLS
jgi:radical SAM protein with 4Fe4S-binding SPASM domain